MFFNLSTSLVVIVTCQLVISFGWCSDLQYIPQSLSMTIKVDLSLLSNDFMISINEQGTPGRKDSRLQNSWRGRVSVYSVTAVGVSEKSHPLDQASAMPTTATQLLKLFSSLLEQICSSNYAVSRSCWKCCSLSHSIGRPYSVLHTP